MSYLTDVIEDRTAVCTFAIAETDPRPRCTNPATRHVALLAADLVSLHTIAACDEHVETARDAAGEHFVQEHTHQGWCDLPGSLWSFDLNACVLDDSGVSLAAAVSLVGAS